MILRNVITQQNEIKKILSTLCLNNPIMCSKQNTSGYGSNNRVIVVRGDHFQFYNLPSNFTNGDNSALTQNQFKARVNLADIYQLSFLPEAKNEKKSIMLSIPLNKLTAKNLQLYKSSASKVTKQKQSVQNFIMNWLFTFNFDVKQHIFKKLQEEQKKKKQEQQKIIRHDPQSQLGDSILNISSIKNNQQDFNAVKDLDENIQKLKQVKQFIEFKQKLQKQEQQRQNIIKKSVLIKKSEKDIDQTQEQQQDQQNIYPIRFQWREFWKVYEKASRELGNPISKDYIQKQLQMLGQLYKLETQIRNIAIDYINFKLVGWGPDKIVFDDFEYYRGIWIKLGGKQLNQQFLSNYYLSDLMYSVKSYKKMKFRIPPMFFVNYKCCKAICMIDLPFSSIKKLSKQRYNVKAEKLLDIQLINKLKQGLQMFQRILNIKNENYINGSIQTNAPLGCDVKVFQYDNKFQQGSSNFLQSFFYITGVKGLFPPDFEYQMHKYQPQYCLRPQIIAQYRDYMQSVFVQDNQLLTQAFKHSQISLDIKGKEDLKVAKVSKEFIPIKIKKLMQLFNQINLIMVDSYSIKQYMSQMGINARYLGYMYKQTQIPYIQETLQIEMLSRVVKKFYCESVKQLITSQSFFKRQLYLKKHKEVLVQNMKQHHILMVNNAVDFLNLVFGIGKETEAFWRMVIKKCFNKYGHQFYYPLKVKAGCLLHAVIWHCGFIVNFDLDIRLFEVQKPFDRKNFVDFRFECKSFDYPSLQVNRIIKKLCFIQQFKKEDELEKYVFTFLKIQLLRNHTSYGLGFKTQMTLSKINNKGVNYQKPIRDSNYHPCQLPFYFSNKSNQNFKKAVDIINFSLASNHPLFISLYDAYSSQFQPQLLKKSTLLAAIKGLGQFHPRTTELYSKFYRQGLQQFQIKAKRSQELQAALIISQQQLSKKKYESCLNFCLSRIQKFRKRISSKSNDLQLYIQILKHGLISAVQTRFYQRGLQIAEQFSEIINTYKIRKLEDHQILLQHALIIRLSLASQKFYLYKMVLLVVKIQKQFEQNLKIDEAGLLLPRQRQQRQKILKGVINQYYSQQTHSKWVQNIFVCLRRGYLYFNYLNDLFNNYKYHINNYGMMDFQVALGYLDVLVRFFGQKLFFDFLYQMSN